MNDRSLPSLPLCGEISFSPASIASCGEILAREDELNHPQGPFRKTRRGMRSVLVSAILASGICAYVMMHGNDILGVPESIAQGLAIPGVVIIALIAMQSFRRAAKTMVPMYRDLNNLRDLDCQEMQETVRLSEGFPLVDAYRQQVVEKRLFLYGDLRVARSIAAWCEGQRPMLDPEKLKETIRSHAPLTNFAQEAWRNNSAILRREPPKAY